MVDTATVAIGIGLVSLWVGIVAMWLVADFSKRVLAEAKQVIDASTTAIWKSVAALERNAKALAANQQEMAAELQRLRESVHDTDGRTRDLHGRAAAHRQEIDRIHGRITAITRVLTTFAPVPEFHDDVQEPTAAAANGDSTLEKLRRAAGPGSLPGSANPSRRVG
ncbi:MAG: hypothetical protein EXQ86_11460 [Rhodospirillales bacterium]|nr:hypothetical protein [Rhodospirillales bacterium]